MIPDNAVVAGTVCQSIDRLPGIPQPWVTCKTIQFSQQCCLGEINQNTRKKKKGVGDTEQNCEDGSICEMLALQL